MTPFASHQGVWNQEQSGAIGSNQEQSEASFASHEGVCIEEHAAGLLLASRAGYWSVERAEVGGGGSGGGIDIDAVGIIGAVGIGTTLAREVATRSRSRREVCDHKCLWLRSVTQVCEHKGLAPSLIGTSLLARGGVGGRAAPHRGFVRAAEAVATEPQPRVGWSLHRGVGAVGPPPSELGWRGGGAVAAVRIQIGGRDIWLRVPCRHVAAVVEVFKRREDGRSRPREIRARDDEITHGLCEVGGEGAAGGEGVEGVGDVGDEDALRCGARWYANA